MMPACSPVCVNILTGGAIAGDEMTGDEMVTVRVRVRVGGFSKSSY